MTFEQYKNHWNYFLTLEQDMSDTSKFVEHCEANYNTFSFEFFKIIQLSCAEIDSLLKELCKLWEPNSKAKCIKNYAKIIIPKYTKLNEFSTMMNYSGLPLLFCPWQHWTCEASPNWWRDYQHLKHNHTKNFDLATMKNAYYCLSALLIVLNMIRWTFPINEIDFFPNITQRLSINYVCQVAPPKEPK